MTKNSPGLIFYLRDDTLVIAGKEIGTLAIFNYM